MLEAGSLGRAKRHPGHPLPGIAGLNPGYGSRRSPLANESLWLSRFAGKPARTGVLLAANVLLQLLDQAGLVGNGVFDQVTDRQQADQLAFGQHR